MIACLLPLLSASHYSQAKSQLIEKIVAVIEDDMVTLSDLTKYRKLLKSSLGQQHVLFEITPKKTLIKSKKKLLEHIIDQKVILNSISTDSYASLNLPSVERILNSIIKQKGLSRNSLKKKLRKLRVSLTDFKKYLMDIFITNQWLQIEVVSAVQVSNKDINDAYFSEHGRYHFTKYKYEFNQWSFPFNEEGKEKVQTVHKEKDGSQFKSKLKILNENQMNTDIKKAIINILPGQFSKPICIESYCYIFQLLNKSFRNTSPVKTNSLRQKITLQRVRQKLQDWIKTQRNSSIIKKYL